MDDDCAECGNPKITHTVWGRSECTVPYGNARMEKTQPVRSPLTGSYTVPVSKDPLTGKFRKPDVASVDRSAQ